MAAGMAASRQDLFGARRGWLSFNSVPVQRRGAATARVYRTTSVDRTARRHEFANAGPDTAKAQPIHTVSYGRGIRGIQLDLCSPSWHGQQSATNTCGLSADTTRRSGVRFRMSWDALRRTSPLRADGHCVPRLPSSTFMAPTLRWAATETTPNLVKACRSSRSVSDSTRCTCSAVPPRPSRPSPSGCVRAMSSCRAVRAAAVHGVPRVLAGTLPRRLGCDAWGVKARAFALFALAGRQ